MTSVYGVTFVGARKQIFNAMRSRINSVNEEDIYQASGYITRHTFSALEEMFTPARQIMAWLGECARRIAKTGKPVEWITPLGLPVVQPYRRAGRSAVVTLVQTVILEDQNDKLPINVARQKSAFAPNFVHSLDSTHMMLTALAVRDLGLTFASVHDSFWTHAGDVDRMSQVLRESFVRLHSQPVLKQLAASFKRNHPNIDFPPVPARGQLDLNEVLKSKYFFH
jgi:DNA-directed RNA polymerase